jgi:hypothetical protein
MSQPEYLEENLDSRQSLKRQAFFRVPLGLLVFGLFGVSFASFLGGSYGAVFPGIVLAILSWAFVVEAMSALRDLRAEPVTTTGKVRRVWSRGSLLWFFRSHYVYVDKIVFSVDAVTGLSVQPGDTVEVEHWPHTKTVIRFRLVEQAASRTQRVSSAERSRRQPMP